MSLHADFTTLMFYVGLDEIRQQKVRATGAHRSSPALVHVNVYSESFHHRDWQFSVAVHLSPCQRAI